MLASRGSSKSASPSPVPPSSRRGTGSVSSQEWRSNEDDIDKLVAIHHTRSSLSSLGVSMFVFVCLFWKVKLCLYVCFGKWNVHGLFKNDQFEFPKKLQTLISLRIVDIHIEINWLSISHKCNQQCAWKFKIVNKQMLIIIISFVLI